MVGYDAINIAVANTKGIIVTNTPDTLNDCLTVFFREPNIPKALLTLYNVVLFLIKEIIQKSLIALWEN